MDLVALDDLDAFGRETTSELQCVIQDCYHRLIEEPGENLDDLDRGLGIANRLNGVFNPNLAFEVEAELLKDPRVVRCECSITEEATPGEYRIDILIQVGVEVIDLVFIRDADGNLVLKEGVSL